MKKKTAVVVLIILVLAVMLVPGVSAEENILKKALKPFKYLDVEKFYDDYSTFIDLVIYLVIFIGIAKVTLGNRFYGRGGNLVVIGIGTALAVSLLVTQNVIGFNLKSFGSIAAFIFVLLVGITLYFAMKHVGLKTAGSVAIVIVIIYFLLRASNPSLFRWFEDIIPFIHTVILLALVSPV